MRTSGKLAVSAVALCIAASAAALHAATINAISYNFSDGQSYHPVTLSDVIGVVPVANWNDAYRNNITIPNNDAGGNTTLDDYNYDSNGNIIGQYNSGTNTTTGVTATYSANDNWSVTKSGTSADTAYDTTPDAIMNNSYLDTNVTLTVKNIPYAIYDVYAYVGADVNGRLGQAYIQSNTGTSQYFKTDDLTGTAFTGYVDNSASTAAGAGTATYIEWTNVTGSTLQYNQITPSGGGNNGLHGLEIVQVVPEPATLGLLGAGAMGLLLARRRKIA